MARDPTQFRKRKAEYLSEQVEKGNVSKQDAQKIKTLVAAFDEDKPTIQRPAWQDAPANIRKYRSESTLANWLYFLTRYAQHVNLTEATPFEINEIAEEMLSGESPYVKDDGISKGSIRAYQNAARIFYRYHDDLDVSWNEVSVFSRDANSSNSSFEPADILDRDEIDSLQAAATDFRDNAVFNLLLYTGMRNRALRTIRLKDVNPEEGTYRFNPEEGTKDLYKPRAKRPLFNAKGPVREWMKRHPTPDDPEAYLITSNSKFTNPDPTEAISDRTIERVCDRLKESAEIDKPMHPHMLRHNFVYICKRVYEIPDDTIRFYLGHADDSKVMEETYSHLSAEDHLEQGQIAAGEIDANDENVGFELESCNTCGEHLPENAKACPKCGTVLTPDAKSAQDKMQEDTEQAIPEVESEEEAKIVQEMLKQLRENPGEMIDD